jgi:phytoene desaturase
VKGPSVVVIGAGLAGITAATHLARAGCKVTVVEKNAVPGGRCGRLARDGHLFDTGPTLFVMPGLYESEFTALGVPMWEALELQRVDPTYHLVFDDGSRLALTSDPDRMRAQLEGIEPGSHRGFLRYLEEGRRHYELAVERLVKRDFRTPGDFFNLENLRLVRDLKPFVPHYRSMSAYFHHPRLKAAFTFQDVYMGLSPFEAPATFSMMAYTELAHGVYYPNGGMYRVVEVLMDIAQRAGVEFVFKAGVERIDVLGDRARGVALSNGAYFPADVVVANADLPYVYAELLPDRALGRRMANKRFSCSVISFFWGLDRPFAQLPPHTLFLADDYRENFKQITRDLTLPENPSLYVHAPARLDPAMAPTGRDTLIAIVPVGHLGAHPKREWRGIRDRARAEVFRRMTLLGIDDLAEHIRFEIDFTPLSWRKRYNLAKGATHGLSHNLGQLGYFRPHNRHSRYHNLYFTGASTHPGTGMPTALVSGRLAAERVLDDLSLSDQTSSVRTPSLA